MRTVANELDAMLTLAGDSIRDAQAFQHEHGLTSHATRKLPGNALHAIRAWQKHIAAAVHGDTVNRTEATAPETGSQAGDEVGKSHRLQGAAEVAIAPTVSIRVPVDLREQAEAFGRERRWTLGEVVRVGLERLVEHDGQEQDDTQSRPAA
jgi:hypothetical protein